jgi:flavin-dependent dehydrogenase
MFREEFDTIIVGAGPAGSTTATLLARAGYKVLLLDREEFPRAKPCGDCLSAGATRILHDLGVLPRIEAESPARLEGWRIVAPGGNHFYRAFASLAPAIPSSETALAIPRERLDRILLDAARRAGAEVRTGVRVVDLTRNGAGAVTGVSVRVAGREPRTLRARLVVGADGLRSIVARRLELLRRLPRLRKVSLTAHLTGIGMANTIGMGSASDAPTASGAPGRYGELHLAPGACVGLAPVHVPARPGEAALHNLTLVVDGDRFARSIARAGTAPFFRAMLLRFPRLRERLPDLGAATDPLPCRLLASGPFDWPTRTVVADGAALVGDAAGYYDPFTGQGIYQGIASALILAEEATAALGAHRRPPALRRYARRRADLIRGPRLVQHLIEAVVSRPALADFAITRLARAPAAAGALIAITGDLRPARSLLSPGVAMDLLRSSARTESR